MEAVVGKYAKYAHQLEKGLPPNNVVAILKERVERQKDRMTVITNLRNDSFKPRHWVKIEEILGQTMPTEEDETILTLELLESWEAFEHTEEIEEVSGQASGEAALEVMLKKVTLSNKTHFLLFLLGGGCLENNRIYGSAPSRYKRCIYLGWNR